MGGNKPPVTQQNVYPGNEWQAFHSTKQDAPAMTNQIKAPRAAYNPAAFT